MGRVEIITGRERRRHWPDEEKLAILEEAMAPGVSMASVARRRDLFPQQLYAWKRALMKPNAGTPPSALEVQSFLPVEVSEPPVTPDPAIRRAGKRLHRRSGLIEIVLGNGRMLRVPSEIGTEDLRRLVRTLEEA